MPKTFKKDFCLTAMHKNEIDIVNLGNKTEFWKKWPKNLLRNSYFSVKF